MKQRVNSMWCHLIRISSFQLQKRIRNAFTILTPNARFGIATIAKSNKSHIRHSPHQNEGHSIINPHLHNRYSYISPPPPIKRTTHASPPHSIPCPRPTITNSPIFYASQTNTSTCIPFGRSSKDSTCCLVKTTSTRGTVFSSSHRECGKRESSSSRYISPKSTFLSSFSSHSDINSSICVLKFVTPLVHPFVNPRVFPSHSRPILDKLPRHSIHISPVENGCKCGRHSPYEGGQYVPANCIRYKRLSKCGCSEIVGERMWSSP